MANWILTGSSYVPGIRQFDKFSSNRIWVNRLLNELHVSQKSWKPWTSNKWGFIMVEKLMEEHSGEAGRHGNYSCETYSLSWDRRTPSVFYTGRYFQGWFWIIYSEGWTSFFFKVIEGKTLHSEEVWTKDYGPNLALIETNRKLFIDFGGWIKPFSLCVCDLFLNAIPSIWISHWEQTRGNP